MTKPDLSAWQYRVSRILQGLRGDSRDDLEALCNRLRESCHGSGTVEAFRQQADLAYEAYRRWHVASSEGVSAILIGWPPGHITPVHDHDGLWGIEMVLSGRLHVEEYVLQNAQPEKTGYVDLDPEAATIFLDHQYAHACSNVGTDPALSLHIYGGYLETFLSFGQGPDGRHEPRRIYTTAESL